MQPEKAHEVKQWFEKASLDLRGAEVDLNVEPPLIEDALFHCQQAVEKAMKGFLTAHDCPFKKTHDLDELARLCENIDASLASLLNPARDLTVFAWEFRYPGDSDTPSVDETKEKLQIATFTYDTLFSRLPE